MDLLIYFSKCAHLNTYRRAGVVLVPLRGDKKMESLKMLVPSRKRSV